MKALAFNGSARTNKGNTALLLAPFVEGLKEAGADTEVFYTKRLHIGPCQAESNCQFKHPGQCFQDDDHDRDAADGEHTAPSPPAVGQAPMNQQAHREG